VLELGCFDGKLLDYFPVKPDKYLGFDANWEGGLDLGKARWAEYQNFEFVAATSPAEMRISAGEKFDLCVSMETLEHVPPEMVEGYLDKLSLHLDGYLFVTVPNEKGVLFLLKWLGKAMLTGGNEHYTLKELCFATFGKLHKVERREHKGFDYDELIRLIADRFEIIEVSGHPFRLLPKALCFGIGIVALGKPKVEERSTV
jgi:cyclopropane fatty-acyl-phospholipid synthase-like methyltransferase